jgi:hypothetical protein
MKIDPTMVFLAVLILPVCGVMLAFALLDWPNKFYKDRDFKKWFSRTRKPASERPPVVVSCHHRIETFEGYKVFREARAAGDRFLRVRFLGCSHFDSIPIGEIDPSGWESTAAELERFI